MWNWLRRLLRVDDAPEAARPGREDASVVRGLELEVEEARAQVERLTADLERERERAAGAVEAGVDARLDALIRSAASAVAQLHTQGHLLEQEERPVQVRDVLQVARRLVRALEDVGVGLEGNVGERVPFDPGRHEPVGDVLAEPGESVEVRFAAVTFRGRIVKRAGVLCRDGGAAPGGD